MGTTMTLILVKNTQLSSHLLLCSLTDQGGHEHSKVEVECSCLVHHAIEELAVVTAQPVFHDKLRDDLPRSVRTTRTEGDQVREYYTRPKHDEVTNQ